MRPVLLIVSALCLPTAAWAVDVSGKVVATPGFGTPVRPDHEEDRAFYWEVPNGIVPTVPYRIRQDEQLTVTLQGPGLEGDQPANIDVQIGGASMIPQTVVAPPGSQLRFINHSGLTVQLYAPGLAGFAPEPLHTAHMRIVPVPQAGAYQVLCGQHPNFRGWVLVAPGLRQGRVAADGSFSFPDLPAGTYELKILFRGDAVFTRSVRVAADDVDLGEVRLGAPPPEAAPAAAAAPVASEDNSRGRRGRGGRGSGGGGARPAAAPAAPAGPAEPQLAPGELRPHRLSGGP